jgi:hypothetical protein
MNNGQANLTTLWWKNSKKFVQRKLKKEIGTTYKTTCDDGSYKSKVQKTSTMVVVFCNQFH